MCIDIERIVATDGNFDGVPPAGISFAVYRNLMDRNSGSGSSEKNKIYNAR